MERRQATYLATDRQMLPMKEGAGDGVAQVVAIDPIWDRSPRGKAKIGFWLRNTGGGDAEEVKLTIRLRDGAGKVVLEHPFVPEDGKIPAGYAKQQEVIIDKTPSFSTIQIAISKSEQSTFALDTMDFTGGNVVEVGRVEKKDGALTGAVRNGTTDSLSDVEVTLYFTDAQGATVAERTVTIASIKPGAVADLSVPLDDIPAWVGYETDLAYGIVEAAGAASDGGAAAVAAKPQVIVEGLALTILEHAGASGVLKIQAELHNQTGAALPGLALTLEVAGASAPLQVQVGDLGKDERLTLSLLAEGVEALTGLGMSWVSKAHDHAPCRRCLANCAARAGRAGIHALGAVFAGASRWRQHGVILNRPSPWN